MELSSIVGVRGEDWICPDAKHTGKNACQRVNKSYDECVSFSESLSVVLSRRVSFIDSSFGLQEKQQLETNWTVVPAKWYLEHQSELSLGHS